MGENNAGKSTVVKAMLALLDYLNTKIDYSTDEILNQQFYFNNSYFAHIGTFQRALNNNATEEKIYFDIASDLYNIHIEVAGDKGDEQAISGRISKFVIKLSELNIDFIFDFFREHANVVFHKYSGISFAPNNLLNEIIYTARERSILKKYYKAMVSDIEIENIPLSGINTTISTPTGLIAIILRRITATIEESQKQKKDPAFNDPMSIPIDESKLKFLTDNAALFNVFIPVHYYGVNDEFSKDNVEYIYAHAVTQTAMYSAKDINDYYVKTIHEFANQRIVSGTPVHSFILKWMNVFNIGKDYEIKSYGGEAHEVKITNEDNTIVNLADKGMGSIQLMILLFRLATKMSQSKIGYGGKSVNLTIIVEEPEQNLHPKLQSKLAELFFYLNQEYGIKFIIETHSEYLIRRTQAIVGSEYNKNEDFINPFKVYYFPATGIPYDMPYAKSGRFEEQFGSGFFDEATKWNREILRNENAR